MQKKEQYFYLYISSADEFQEFQKTSLRYIFFQNPPLQYIPEHL